jgi:hypothetical protein
MHARFILPLLGGVQSPRGWYGNVSQRSSAGGGPRRIGDWWLACLCGRIEILQLRLDSRHRLACSLSDQNTVPAAMPCLQPSKPPPQDQSHATVGLGWDDELSAHRRTAFRMPHALHCQVICPPCDGLFQGVTGLHARGHLHPLLSVAI